MSLHQQFCCTERNLPFGGPTLLSQFLAATASVTEHRASFYGNVAEDFARVAAIKEAVAECANPRIRHCLEMIAVKMSRIVNSPDHLDSWVDIVGYCKCAVMILDEERKNGN